MTDDAKAKHSPFSHKQRMGYFAFQIASGEDPAKVLGMVMHHANDLAAERDELATKHKIVCECVKVVDGSNESLRRQIEAERAKVATLGVMLTACQGDCATHARVAAEAETKLQAAERVISALRDSLDDSDYCYLCGGEPYEEPHSDELEHTAECALSAYDAINQGSRGGAGEGVG